MFKKIVHIGELGNHAVSTIVDRLGLSLKNWLVCQQDQTFTNENDVCLIKKNAKDTNPTKTTVPPMD